MEVDPGAVGSIDGYEWTPLHYAANFGYMDVAVYLLDQGADINTRDEDGWTALDRACDQGHVGMVNLLVSRGADPVASESSGMTPLMMAANTGQLAVVRYLLRVKAVRANVDAVDIDGWTALW